MKEDLKYIYEEILKPTAYVLISPLTIPTSIRKINETEVMNDIFENSLVGTSIFSLAALFLSTSYELHLFENSEKMVYPEFYIPFVLTNLSSGYYEILRYAKKGLEENRASYSNSKPTLEEKVEIPVIEIKVEEKPTKIINPWEVEVDKLENLVLGERK